MKIIKNRFIFFAISMIVILSGFASMVYYSTVKKQTPLNYGIEFSGGTSMKVEIGKEFDKEEIKTIVQEVIGSEHVQVQKIKGENSVDIRYSLPKVENKEQKVEEVVTKPAAQEVAKEATVETTEVNGEAEVVAEEAPVETTVKEEKVEKQTKTDNEYVIEIKNKLKEKYELTNENFSKTESISATISSEMQVDALLAIFIATICILIYITYRFRDYKFGLSAVVALIHDVLIVFAVYAVLRIPINNSFVAAMLTIVGYSINDTIVVFDRIRENQRLVKKGENEELVDRSVKETMTRSINTSITTLIAIVALYVVGTDMIKEFTLPLIVGVIAGTYSSIAIASPVWYQLNKKITK